MTKLLALVTLGAVLLSGCGGTKRLEGEIVKARALDDTRVVVTYKVTNSGNENATALCTVTLSDAKNKELAVEQFNGEAPMPPGESEELKVTVKVPDKQAAAVSQTTVECIPA